MNRKSFWKRTNRGFLASMVLLAAVVIYVVAGQLMLIPHKQEIRKLADDLESLWQETTLLSDTKRADLDNPAALQAEQARIREKLESLFVPDSDYLDAGVDTVTSELEDCLNSDDRPSARDFAGVKVSRLNIQEDVASVELFYRYETDGLFFRFDDNSMENGSLVQAEDIEETLSMSMTCKRVNGEWKIFRIRFLYSNYDNREWYGEGGDDLWEMF